MKYLILWLSLKGLVEGMKFQILAQNHENWSRGEPTSERGSQLDPPTQRGCAVQ